MAKNPPRGSFTPAAPRDAREVAQPADAPEEPSVTESEPPDPAAALEATATPDNYEQQMLLLLPPSERSKPGAVLFAEACYIYGIDPNPAKKPVEILGPWKFYEGDTQLTPPVPDRIKVVTAGGTKVVHPMDQDFEDKLRHVLHAYHIDRKTQQRIDDPLPPDLTLPRELVNGIVVKTEHQFKGGYLRARATERAKSTARR